MRWGIIGVLVTAPTWWVGCDGGLLWQLSTAGGTGGAIESGVSSGSTSAGGAPSPASVGAGGSAPGGGRGVGGRSTSGMGGVGGSAPAVGGGGAAGTTTCQPVTCQSGLYDCGDCVDNDGDGSVDMADEHCTGPCDNTESDFHYGIPWFYTAPCHLDCGFDADPSSGNDDCHWSYQCDPLMVAPDYPVPSLQAVCPYDPTAIVYPPMSDCGDYAAGQSAQCLNYCGDIMPNGCDCFGCCELPAESGNFVRLASGGQQPATPCTLADVTDPTICNPCTPAPNCFNPCDTCELCLGKDTLPAPCGDVPSCTAGAQPCDARQPAPCPQGQFCLTGCCASAP